MLTTFDDDDSVYGSLRAGASGFLVKDMGLDDILAAIRIVAGGDALIAPRVTRRLIDRLTTEPPSTAETRTLAGSPTGSGSSSPSSRTGCPTPR